MNGTTKAAVLVATLLAGLAYGQPPGRRADSPAASPIPGSRVEQSYPAELIAAGSTLFAAQCGFCHGRDTRGGAGGADLARSEVVAQDLRGDLIGPVVRSGIATAGMPPFAAISDTDLGAIVAFIHEQRSLAAQEEGGRQSVSVDDLLSGDVERGRRYFEAQCTGCHSADGDLAGIAGRMQGLRLLQRMLYPSGGGFGSAPSRAQTTVAVRTADGERYRGALVFRDEFAVALRDAEGQYRSFVSDGNEIEVSNPLDGHIEQLGRYTDADMHDVITYLHTLR